MIKVLYISNMYPSKAKAYAGIFVKKQVDYIQKNYKNQVELSIYTLKRTFTSSIGSILKYIFFFIKFLPYLFKKYDVVHIHYLVPTIILGFIYKLFHPKTLLVVTLHGRDITVQYPNNKKLFSYTASYIDLIIPVGETLRKMAVCHFPKTEMKILPVGVDDNIFKVKRVGKEYDFIFVGSLIKRKGIDTLLDALREENKYQFKILIIGSGEFEKELSMLKSQHIITILKNLNQNEIADNLSLSKWLILPSRNEGFPTVTIEAMFCGIPVIGSDIPQIKEQVYPFKNGLLFPVENASELLQIMNKAFEVEVSKYNKYCKNASNSFKELGLSKVCSILISLYNERL